MSREFAFGSSLARLRECRPADHLMHRLQSLLKSLYDDGYGDVLV